MSAVLIIPSPIYSGDAFTIPVKFWTDSTNTTALNMTGNLVGLTIKENINDPDEFAVFKKDLAGDSSGVFNFNVPGLVTCTYWVDAKMWTGSASGPRSPVVTPQQFSVLQSITARAAAETGATTPPVFNPSNAGSYVAGTIVLDQSGSLWVGVTPESTDTAPSPPNWTPAGITPPPRPFNIAHAAKYVAGSRVLDGSGDLWLGVSPSSGDTAPSAPNWLLIGTAAQQWI